MAVVTQLNLNVGTEQNPNFVLHDINDKRISTTAVTTATHLLTCNSGVTSIAPITAANLASVLGAAVVHIDTPSDLNNITAVGVHMYTYLSVVPDHKPSGTSNYSIVVSFWTNYRTLGVQLYVDTAANMEKHFYLRFSGINGWRSWVAIG